MQILSKRTKKTDVKVQKDEAVTKKAVKVMAPSTWYLFDAKDKVLGRLASEVAKLLTGKNSAKWAPNVDPRINIVILNVAKVAVTGNKEDDKLYYRYSGYPGGLRSDTLKKLRSEKPEEVFKHAVKGMLPKNKLGAKILGHLFIYPGNEHPHTAQKPVEVK